MATDNWRIGITRMAISRIPIAGCGVHLFALTAFIIYSLNNSIYMPKVISYLTVARLTSARNCSILDSLLHAPPKYELRICSESIHDLLKSFRLMGHPIFANLRTCAV